MTLTVNDMWHIAVCRVDLSFVVDHSGSIKNTVDPTVSNWHLIKEFMVKVVQSINVGQHETHVGAVSFGLLQTFNTFLL